jgi:hypothetical protein
MVKQQKGCHKHIPHGSMLDQGLAKMVLKNLNDEKKLKREEICVAILEKKSKNQTF